MSFEAAKNTAGRHLIEGATLDELRAAAEDLRALTPDSALAELVESKIQQLLSNDDGADEGA